VKRCPLFWVKAGVDPDYLQYLMKRAMTSLMIRLDSVGMLPIEELGNLLEAMTQRWMVKVELVWEWAQSVFPLE